VSCPKCGKPFKLGEKPGAGGQGTEVRGPRPVVSTTENVAGNAPRGAAKPAPATPPKPPPAPTLQPPLPRAHSGTRGITSPPASSAQPNVPPPPPPSSAPTSPAAADGFVPLDFDSAAQATQPAHQPPAPPLPVAQTGMKTIDPLMLGPQPRPKPPPATEVPVVCRLCGTRMYAPLEKIGQTIKCPDCHTDNEILGPKKPPPAKKPGPTLDDTPDFGLGEPGERPAYRPIVAPRGDYAELAEFDPSQRPPGWSRPERRARAEAAETAAPTATAEEEEEQEEIIVSAPVERIELKPEIKPLPPPDPQDSLYDGKYDDGLIGDWDDRKKPDAWKRAPLTIGILSFPFQLNNLVRVILYSIGLAIVANVLRATIEWARSDDPSALVGAIFGCMVTAVGMGCLVASFAAVLLAIVQDTANGADEVSSYPDWNVGEWLVTSMYFPAAAFLAGLPGSFFTTALLGFGLDPRYGAFAAVAPLVLSWIVLFPLVLYSMLAEASILAPYSAATYKSLQEVSEGWVFFYMYAALLGMLGGTALAFLASPTLLFSSIGSIGVVLVAVLYCRILGRLMWYASEKMARLERERAE